MENDKEIVSGLSKTLFWDVDISTIDPGKHAHYIIERVLLPGKMDDFRLLKVYCGKPKIRRISKQMRYMNNRLLHFCSAYFNTPIIELRCYTQKQLNHPNWNY